MLNQSKGPFTLMLLLPLFLLSHTANAERHIFSHQGIELAGHYLPSTLDKDTSAKAILIFVHGDGAMTYDAHGYYEPYWDTLRAQGYAIFSWDKPGVGDSKGNWLQQSMQERQSEVLAAINFAHKTFGFDASNTGLIGFSQAGWVIPALANNTGSIAFAIGIGFAANWLEQGKYHSIQAARIEQLSNAQINTLLKEREQNIEFLSKAPNYKEYRLRYADDPMSQERFEFVSRNFRADAGLAYRSIEIPLLLIWGQDDLNVDAQHEYVTRKREAHPLIDLTLIPKASHALLKSSDYNQQNFGIGTWIKLMWQGEEAFAPSALPTITKWLAKRALSKQQK